MPDHWTAKEVDKHLAAADIIKKKTKKNRSKLGMKSILCAWYSRECTSLYITSSWSLPVAWRILNKDGAMYVNSKTTTTSRKRKTIVRQATNQDLTVLNMICQPEVKPSGRSPQSKDIQRAHRLSATRVGAQVSWSPQVFVRLRNCHRAPEGCTQPYKRRHYPLLNKNSTGMVLPSGRAQFGANF